MFLQQLLPLGSCKELDFPSDCDPIGSQHPCQDLPLELLVILVLEVVDQCLKLLLVFPADLILVTFVQDPQHLKIHIEGELPAHFIAVLLEELALSGGELVL